MFQLALDIYESQRLKILNSSIPIPVELERFIQGWRLTLPPRETHRTNRSEKKLWIYNLRSFTYMLFSTEKDLH
jgi:hypothetical protein